jgi:hypothetical protein
MTVTAGILVMLNFLRKRIIRVAMFSYRAFTMFIINKHGDSEIMWGQIGTFHVVGIIISGNYAHEAITELCIINFFLLVSYI